MKFIKTAGTGAVIILLISSFIFATTYYRLRDTRIEKYTVRDGLSYRWDCPSFMISCDSCGANCHKNSVSIKSYTKEAIQKHETEYFPKLVYLLPVGRKLTRKDGSSIAWEGRHMVLMDKNGRKVMNYPPNSKILKDKSGNPFLVLMPSEPEIFKK